MASRRSSRRSRSSRRRHGDTGLAIVTVLKSPFPKDYRDPENAPPWRFSGSAFRGWVWEVLLDEGKAGASPRNVAQAVDIARDAGYEIEVSRGGAGPISITTDGGVQLTTMPSGVVTAGRQTPAGGTPDAFGFRGTGASVKANAKWWHKTIGGRYYTILREGGHPRSGLPFEGKRG